MTFNFGGEQTALFLAKGQACPGTDDWFLTFLLAIAAAAAVITRAARPPAIAGAENRLADNIAEVEAHALRV